MHVLLLLLLFLLFFCFRFICLFCVCVYSPIIVTQRTKRQNTDTPTITRFRKTSAAFFFLYKNHIICSSNHQLMNWFHFIDTLLVEHRTHSHVLKNSLFVIFNLLFFILNFIFFAFNEFCSVEWKIETKKKTKNLLKQTTSIYFIVEKRKRNKFLVYRVFLSLIKFTWNFLTQIN